MYNSLTLAFEAKLANLNTSIKHPFQITNHLHSRVFKGLVEALHEKIPRKSSQFVLQKRKRDSRSTSAKSHTWQLTQMWIFFNRPTIFNGLRKNVQDHWLPNKQDAAYGSGPHFCLICIFIHLHFCLEKIFSNCFSVMQQNHLLEKLSRAL